MFAPPQPQSQPKPKPEPKPEPQHPLPPGVQQLPTQNVFESVLTFVTSQVRDHPVLVTCLNFLAQTLRVDPSLFVLYQNYHSNTFLPAKRLDPLHHAPETVWAPPDWCFTDTACQCMGFPLLDPTLITTESQSSWSNLLCNLHPGPDELLCQLMDIVRRAQLRLEAVRNTPENKHLTASVLKSFVTIFNYLSTRKDVFHTEHIQILREMPFIPHLFDGQNLKWFKPTALFFKNHFHGVPLPLLPIIPFNHFLSTIGVLPQPTHTQVLSALLDNPQHMLDKLDPEKYSQLLQRLASHITPQQQSITSNLSTSPFLLAYRRDSCPALFSDTHQPKTTQQYTLANAADICILDSPFLADMFDVLKAPRDPVLENLYKQLGSPKISELAKETVSMRFVKGDSTSTTEIVKERLKERRHVLISSRFKSHLLLEDASQLLTTEQLVVYEAEGITIRYTLREQVSECDVSCCLLQKDDVNEIYVTPSFDWFAVADVIGKLILKSCYPEDIFLLGSILRAPLSQLRARGLPVDPVYPIEGRVSSDQTPESPTLESSLKNIDLNSGASACENKSDNASIDRMGAYGKEPTESPIRTHKKVRFQLPFGDSQALHVTPPSENTFSPRKKLLTCFESPQSEGTGSPTASHNLEKDDGSENEFQSSGIVALMKENSDANRIEDEDCRETDVQQPPDTTLQERELHRPLPTAMGARRESAFGRLQHRSKEAGRGPISDEVCPPGCCGTSIGGSGAKDDGGDAHRDFKLTLYTRSITNSKTSGVPVYLTGPRAEFETFSRKNRGSVKRFAKMLKYLCVVYKLGSESVAIFYESTGRTVGFNRKATLFFNLHHFAANHDKGGKGGTDCYLYWYAVMAHQLAHNLVNGHTLEHVQRTKSYFSTYRSRFEDMRRLLEM